MKPIKVHLMSVILLLSSFMVPPLTHAGVLTTLHKFSGGDGQNPQATLTLGTNGSFYGSTAYGGAYGFGTIFRVTTNGTVLPVVSFEESNGANPYSRLLSLGGILFGTTPNGGPSSSGTVFQLSSSNTVIVMASFPDYATDGAFPYAGLIADPNGVLYGTTASGGADGLGTVFRMNTSDTAVTSLLSFNFVNGWNPEGRLYLHTNGYFYGTTVAGGADGAGTLFKMTSSGALSNSFSFRTTNGASPWAGLTQGSDGALYGTTAAGGAAGGYGAVFRVTTNDEAEMLAAFDDTNGANPYAELTLGPDGNLYGVTRNGGANNHGTIFRVTTGGTLTSLFSFNNANGSQPYGGLVFGSDGHLYGTTIDGGTGSGTVFRFILNPPTPVFQTVSKTNGIVTMTWSAVAGGDYLLQYKTNLAQTGWLDLDTPVTATNSTGVASDAAGPAEQRFYRVALLQ